MLLALKGGMYVRTVSEFVCIQGGNIEDILKARRAGGLARQLY